MVRSKTRRHRSSRRLERKYLPKLASKRPHVLSMFPLPILTLSLLVTKPLGAAGSLAHLAVAPALSRAPITLALGRAFQLSQVPEPLPITQQGSQISLNGRSYTAVWSQRPDRNQDQNQDQIGIADTGLIQSIGLDLLSSNDATKQPIEWFSDQRTNPIELPTWQNGAYRYLDIDKLAQQFGWQVETNGTALKISTPAAQVTGLRQGRQTWGDRMVVDLDRATPWQVDEQAGSVTVTIDAQIDPALIQGFTTRSGSYISNISVATSQNRTVIRLSIPSEIRPRVWTVPNPNRLLIDIRPDALVERDILWAPGVHWRQKLVQLGSNQFPVVWVEVDPRQPGVRIKPIVSSTTGAVGTSPLLLTAQRMQAIAAINGGFFNRNTQLPLGAIRRDQEWMSGPILGRGAIGWNDAGEVTVGRLKLQETLTTENGKNFSIVYLNSGYVGAGVYRHTRAWGSTYTPILNHELVVTVENDRVTQRQQSTSAGQPQINIPSDGYLLVVREDATAAQALAIGTKVELATSTEPTNFSDYPDIVGAGPLLMQDGQIVLNPQAEQFSAAFQQQAASRSVIATSSKGTLMLVTVHNRVNGAGPTLAEAAQLMRQIGAVNALNLDGGSSSALYLGGLLLDRPPSTAARVHNGIGVFIEANSAP